MREVLAGIDWQSRLQELDVEDSWTEINAVLDELKSKYIPKKKPKTFNGKHRKPVPQTVLDKIRLKRKTFKHYKRFRTKANFKAYARARNQVKWALRNSVKEREQTLAKNIKSDPKAFFNYVSSMSKPKEGVANLVKEDGSLTVSDSEKAEVLNNFFSSVFTEENKDNIPPFDCRSDKEVSNISISVDDMRKKLDKLNVSKSCGPDGMHPRLVKELSTELALPFKILFDKTLTEGKIPACWKCAEVKPIFKKGDKSKPGNYRPVSLTSIICKIFEGIVRDELNKHLIDNNLLSATQFGFTTGRSCITQLLSTMNDWLKCLDAGEPVDAIYLDLQKAFDKVPHARLMTKLECYGVKGNILTWIKEFLSDRTQFVTVGSCSSGTAPVSSGVPQGSVLGPTLFIYFINDMPDVLSCLVKIFADDTKAYSSVQSSDKKLELQENIDKLLEWTEKWQIKFNSDKCKVLHLRKNNPCYTYSMKGSDLESTNVEKDLGVHVDDKLNFEFHITESIKKANRMVGMLSRFLVTKDKDVMIPLYKSLVRPILEYGNAIWYPSLRKNVNAIENVQRRFTKRVKDMKDIDYDKRLKTLKLPSLEYRRIRGDMIETYKILHGLYDSASTSNLLYINNASTTRGHPLKLIKPSVNTNLYRNFFSNRVINNWNSLPEHIVLSGSLNIFKSSLDNHWANLQYSTNIC